MSDTKRARYTLEFKMEAVRLVKGGQVAAVTAKVLGIPKQTLENWVRLDGKGTLFGSDGESLPIDIIDGWLGKNRGNSCHEGVFRDAFNIVSLQDTQIGQRG